MLEHRALVIYTAPQAKHFSVVLMHEGLLLVFCCYPSEWVGQARLQLVAGCGGVHCQLAHRRALRARRKLDGLSAHSILLVLPCCRRTSLYPLLPMLIDKLQLASCASKTLLLGHDLTACLGH